jgi:hypothetical protein
MSPPSNAVPGQSDGRLDSWKEIAAYLGRNERTVRRWEEREGLPVRRLVHEKRSSVYAYKRELDDWWEQRGTAVAAGETLPVEKQTEAKAARSDSRHGLLWMLTGVLLAAVAFGTILWLAKTRQAPTRNVQVSRLTYSAGVVKDEPALSLPGKTIAFVPVAEGRRHIWVRLLGGGSPLRITTDATDHEQPRWSPDSSSLIYYSPSQAPDEQGTIWEIPALGGSPRRITVAVSGGDLSHDGASISLFRSENGRIELVTVPRRYGSSPHRITEVPAGDLHQHPRWSPDDRWIAFQSNAGATFDERIYVVPATGGQPKAVARADNISGFSWLNDVSGILYSSSSGSTVLYPPVFNLRLSLLKDVNERQLTFGDISYVQPDLQPSGSMVASRITRWSDFGVSPSTVHLKTTFATQLELHARPARFKRHPSVPMGRKLSTCPIAAVTEICGSPRSMAQRPGRLPSSGTSTSQWEFRFGRRLVTR